MGETKYGSHNWSGMGVGSGGLALISKHNFEKK